MKKLYLLIMLLLPVVMLAQTRLPDNMFLKKLPNGLDVLVVEDNTVPLATIMITCKNGSYTESPEFNGLSHLYEHMFFKANKDYGSADEFLNRTFELGIKYNGETSFEHVYYYITLPDYNLKPGLQFMNSAIRYPKFSKKEIESENIIVDGEFQRKESNPSYALSDAMEHHLWGGLYSRKNPIGNHSIIRSATPALMDSIKNKYYFPNNSLLTVAGNVSHEEVFKEVEKIYGSWKQSAFDPFKKWPVPEFKPLLKPDYFIVESKLSKVPLIMMQWEGPDTRNDIKSTYAADVFSYILNQNSSTFKKTLVQSGLALQVGMSYLTSSHVGPISIQIVPNPAKIRECLDAVKKQIQLMDSPDYITDDQLETAKRKLAINIIREQEITSDYVKVLSFWWASASLDYLTTYIGNLNKITKADLQDYVRKYIKDKPYCAGLLLNPDNTLQADPKDFFTASN